MQRPTAANDFDHASLEAMMERYRDELLRYQRATPPGKPTLAQNLEASERARSVRTETTGTQQSTQSRAETQTRASQNRPPTAQPVFENKKAAGPSEVRREKIPVDTPPILLPQAFSSRFQAISQSEQAPVILPQLPVREEMPPTSVVPPVMEVPVQQPPVALPVMEVPVQQPPVALPVMEMPVQQPPVALPVIEMPVQSLIAPPVLPIPVTVPQLMNMDITPGVESVCTVEETPDKTGQQMSPLAVVSEPMPLSQPAPEGRQMTEAPALRFVPDNVVGPMPQQHTAPPVEPAPYVQLEQLPAPAKNERVVAPVPEEQPGCIAHTEFEKAAGAYGVFRPYERMGKYTLASFLQTPGEAIQTLVRFAADVPVGSADAVRCRRSFTVKFFCREGEYDLFGMHLPVSVGTTEKTLIDCCAVSRPNPKTGLRTREAFWEFLVTHREALHAAMWLYSDLGTIGSYRTIDGYGLPCLWVNARNERWAVRPRWLSRQRPQTLTRFEAEELAGSDPDAVARDLVSSLRAGERPQYELSIQVIEPAEFAALPFDPFDPTAIWPAEQFKTQRIGLLTLERPPDDAEIELDCERFKPENIIPGIEHVPAPAQKSGDDFTQVQQYLRSLGEFSRHRLIDNLSEELLRLPPLLLEQVLILLSQADLEFGQAMTLALGG